MPINRRYNIDTLLAACDYYVERKKQRITFEYILIENVNDSENQAHLLAKHARRLSAKVNLIPYNENPGLGFGDPGAERVAAFRQVLSARGITAMVRKNRGRDIAAACGQLAVQGQREVRSARN